MFSFFLDLFLVFIVYETSFQAEDQPDKTIFFIFTDSKLVQFKQNEERKIWSKGIPFF